MNGPDLREIARALGGEVTGRQVLAPGPGHSRLDRSLSVRLSPDAPGGFVVKSFADDDFAACRDHVAAALGLPLDFWRTRGRDYSAPHRASAPITFTPAGPDPTHPARIARAQALWAAAAPAQGTLAERYLAGRGLELPSGAAVLRFHPACPWRDDATSDVVRVPAMLAAMRQVDDDTLVAVQKTRLGPDATKLGRKMQGVAAGAAIKLDADAEVTMGLSIGEGCETVQQGRQIGFRPGWALGSAGAIAAFPVLPGIEALTIHAERDDTNARAVEACAARWHRAGREITIIEPRIGSDLNDAARGRGA